MGSFGENLRRERELRGITLVELSNATRISRRYLVALETDQFQDLPGGIFNRGFVRSISRYMKLDEHHWMGEYVRAAGEEAEVLARYAPANAAAPSSTSRRVWSLVFLVTLFGVGAYVIHQVRMQRAAEASAHSPIIPKAESDQPPTSAATSPATAAQGEAPSLTASQTPPAPGSGPDALRSATGTALGQLRLQIDTLEDAKLTVAVDGQLIFRGAMKAGETRSLRAGRSIELSTTNAAAVILTLNGRTLAPLGNPGESKKITLTTRDLTQPVP